MSRALASTTDRSRPNSDKSLVGFFVGEVHYAIEIAAVREIVNPLPMTSLPHTPAEVAGVADHRGDVIPVIALRRRFGLDDEEPSRATKWILVRAGEHDVGLVVDRVTEVFGTGEAVRPAPKVGTAADRRGIAGVVNHHETLTFVLDTARFVELVDDLASYGALEPPAQEVDE